MPSESSADDAEQRSLIRDEFDKAEKVLKRYERVGGATLVAAINQLRYAGRHIIDADINGIPEQKRDEHYRRAICHCHRAAFDVREATVIFLLDSIQKFTDQAKACDFDIVTRFIPDYTERLTKASDAQKLLIHVGSLRDLSDQTPVEHAIEDLLDFWNQIRIKSSTINNAQKQADRKERKEDRRFIINCLLSVLGILITIVFSIVGLWYIFNPPNVSAQANPVVGHVAPSLDTKTNTAPVIKR